MKNAMSGYIVCVYGILLFLSQQLSFFLIILVTPKILLSYIFFVIFTPLVAFMLMRIMESSYKAMIIFNAMDNLDTKFMMRKAYQNRLSPKSLLILILNLKM